MAEIVSFTEFQDVYIMTHPTIKSRNQKAQTEWNQIKLKHLTETQIKSKRLPSRQFPDGFHLEAKQLMSNWKRIYGQQKQLNESSNLEQKILAFAASHEFKVLSQGFACLPVRLSSDVVRVIRTYGGISKHMVMFAAFKGLLKCYEVRKFHQLRPNYIIPEKERVTQSQVIDDIMDVNTSIANCAYLPAHIAAKSLKTLKKKKDELHKTLHRMQKHCISQRAYHDGFTQKVRKAAKLSKVKIYHDKPCRPSVEDLNPSFKATLLSIVEENACADPKRRSKVKSTLK
eukprot:48628_1